LAFTTLSSVYVKRLDIADADAATWGHSKM